MGNIDWLPIADIPRSHLDGRSVLLWIGEGTEADACVGTWHEDDFDGAPYGWADVREFGKRLRPTYWAEINTPPSW
jgi:hypothetical protein